MEVSKLVMNTADYKRDCTIENHNMTKIIVNMTLNLRFH